MANAARIICRFTGRIGMLKEKDEADGRSSNVTVVLQTMSGPNNSSMYDTAGWGNPRLVYV